MRERERHETRGGGAREREAPAPQAHADVLGGDERDREADQCLHHRNVRPHVTEHREREGQAVAEREAGHQQQDVAKTPAHEQQREQERYVIGAREDVLAAELR